MFALQSDNLVSEERGIPDKREMGEKGAKRGDKDNNMSELAGQPGYGFFSRRRRHRLSCGHERPGAMGCRTHRWGSQAV